MPGRLVERFSDFDTESKFMEMAERKSAESVDRSPEVMGRRVRRPAAAPGYYLGRPAWVWITALAPRNWTPERF